MDTGTLSVAKIFGQDRRHIVPLFQRPYVWTEEEQWQPLWDDLLVLAQRTLAGHDPRPHFMGAIVLDQLAKPTGHIEVRLVVDGQQRLTTIQLLLTAFRDACAELGFDKYKLALEKLTTNEDPLSEEPDETFKVWPTNADQEDFRQVMQASSAEILCKRYGKSGVVRSLGRPILDAYLYFQREVLEWIGQDEGSAKQRLEALYESVRQGLRLVVIDLGAEDDAQLIFETLNARGTPLLPSDLVKNHIFHRAQGAGLPLERLYQRYWRGFDEEQGYWREELGRGHARRPRIDTFLQYYLTVKTRDEVSPGHLYTVFRDQVMGSDTEAEPHLAELRQYASVYQSFDHMEAGTAVGRFFGSLTALGLTSPYPFLMDLFVQFGEAESERDATLKDLESFLVRRMVCQLSTRGYNRFFIDLLVALHGGEGTPHSRVRSFLLSSQTESGRWPADEEFRSAWMQTPAYRVLNQSRVRMVLEALEREARTGKSEDLQFGKKLTIEHLLPQKWQGTWPLPPEGDPAEAASLREGLLHTMGNLTLVTSKLNPALSNGPWEDKRPEILKHSALALNRGLDDIEHWNEEAIQQRGEELFQSARKIWSRPSGNELE